MQNFVAQTGATFPIGWDAGATYSLFRIAGGAAISPFPLDVVVDRNGNVAYVNREYEPAELTAVIESLLAQN